MQCVHDRSMSLAYFLLLLLVFADACLFYLFQFFLFLFFETEVDLDVNLPSFYFFFGRILPTISEPSEISPVFHEFKPAANSFEVTLESALNILGHSRVQSSHQSS